MLYWSTRNCEFDNVTRLLPGIRQSDFILARIFRQNAELAEYSLSDVVFY